MRKERGRARKSMQRYVHAGALSRRGAASGPELAAFSSALVAYVIQIVSRLKVVQGCSKWGPGSL